MVVITVKFNKETLYPVLLYSQPYKYNDSITLFPVQMKQIIEFQVYSQSITVRKDSRFSNKDIIKMTYLDFLSYAASHMEFGLYYDFPNLQYYYSYLILLLDLVCRDQEIKFDAATGKTLIQNFEITPAVLDDLRRIIILQNDMDFDMDEFLNYETEEKLKNSQNNSMKNSDIPTIEDYIDSLSIALHLSEKEIMDMSIRKFWRFIRRYNLHENYTIMRTGECSGMVSFKEPIKHWMVSIDEHDKYQSFKTSEEHLKSKINQN